MSQRTVILKVPTPEGRAGSFRSLKDVLFDELLRRLEFLERERQQQATGRNAVLEQRAID